jgi:hypothetical protein
MRMINALRHFVALESSVKEIQTTFSPCATTSPARSPDNHVTVLVDPSKGGTTALERFDVGDDEERRTVLKVGPAGGVTNN